LATDLYNTIEYVAYRQVCGDTLPQKKFKTGLNLATRFWKKKAEISLPETWISVGFWLFLTQNQITAGNGHIKALHHQREKSVIINMM
jgi:hypothetical protein